MVNAETSIFLSVGVLLFPWDDSRGSGSTSINVLIFSYCSEAIISINVCSIQETLRRGKDNAPKVAGKLNLGSMWLSKEFHHLCPPTIIYMSVCACMPALPGISCSLLEVRLLARGAENLHLVIAEILFLL